MQFLTFAGLARLVAALSTWPFDWAQRLLRRQQAPDRGAALRALAPGTDAIRVAAAAACQWRASAVIATLDLARTQYAAGVQAGLIERSLLASGAFERRVGRLERLALGPWARRV